MANDQRSIGLNSAKTSTLLALGNSNSLRGLKTSHTRRGSLQTEEGTDEQSSANSRKAEYLENNSEIEENLPCAPKNRTT